MEFNEQEYNNFFDQSILNYKAGSERIKKHLPEMTQGYFDFTDACFKEGELSAKHKQLMALAVAIYAQDEYCIMYHTKGAVEHKATEKEIMETVAVSSALGGGAAFSQGVTLALETYDYYQMKH